MLVSFPPTALVDTPACRTPDGSLRNPATEAFAASLLEGGPACMVRAVQQLSGLRIDHYLGVDLARLPGMVDALGGVPVCVAPVGGDRRGGEPAGAGGSPRCRVSRPAGYLAPGASGSDVTGAAVAERAQRLLTSTLRAAMSTGTLTDPVTLTRFLNRAADALTVDEQTTLGDLRVLAGSLGDLTGDAVQRAGLPVAQVGYVPAGTDQAYVLLDGDRHPAALRRDDRGHRRAGGAHAPGATRRRPTAPPRTSRSEAARAAGGRRSRRTPRPCRPRRSPSTSSTAPRRRGWRRRSPISCAPRASSSARSATSRHGQPVRRPPRSGRRRAGAHRRRRGARRRAAAQ